MCENISEKMGHTYVQFGWLGHVLKKTTLGRCSKENMATKGNHKDHELERLDRDMRGRGVGPT